MHRRISAWSISIYPGRLFDYSVILSLGNRQSVRLEDERARHVVWCVVIWWFVVSLVWLARKTKRGKGWTTMGRLGEALFGAAAVLCCAVLCTRLTADPDPLICFCLVTDFSSLGAAED